jgi:hypothetical protein
MWCTGSINPQYLGATGPVTELPSGTCQSRWETCAHAPDLAALFIIIAQLRSPCNGPAGFPSHSTVCFAACIPLFWQKQLLDACLLRRWGRLTQPLFSAVPMQSLVGSHEIEPQACQASLHSRLPLPPCMTG